LQVAGEAIGDAQHGKEAPGQNQQQQQEQEQEEREGKDERGLEVSPAKGGRKGGRKGERKGGRKGGVAVSTEALTKSFGWSVQDAFTQHDVQVGREGGRGRGREGGPKREKRKEIKW